MRMFAKDVLFGVLPLITPRMGDRAVILMYHSISDQADYFSSVPPQDFEQQMRCLATSGRPIIALSELVDRLKNHQSLRGAIVLTFDDGYEDNYTHAFPVLKKYRFPATIFVTTDRIGGTDERGARYLSAEQLHEMHASGLITIEPHTKSHPKLAKLSEQTACEEIQGSMMMVEDLLGKKAVSFAYPFGNYNDATMRITKELGFAAACTVEEGTVSPDSDRYRLPRNSIDRSTSMAQFRGKVSRVVDLYTRIKKFL